MGRTGQAVWSGVGAALGRVGDRYQPLGDSEHERTPTRATTSCSDPPWAVPPSAARLPQRLPRPSSSARSRRAGRVRRRLRSEGSPDVAGSGPHLPELRRDRLSTRRHLGQPCPTSDGPPDVPRVHGPQKADGGGAVGVPRSTLTRFGRRHLLRYHRIRGRRSPPGRIPRPVVQGSARRRDHPVRAQPLDGSPAAVRRRSAANSRPSDEARDQGGGRRAAAVAKRLADAIAEGTGRHNIVAPVQVFTPAFGTQVPVELRKPDTPPPKSWWARDAFKIVLKAGGPSVAALVIGWFGHAAATPAPPPAMASVETHPSTLPAPPPVATVEVPAITVSASASASAKRPPGKP